MERTKLGLSKDKMYKALGEGERTSKKVASIRMSDGSTFKRKNANQHGMAEGGNDYTEKRSNRTDRFDLGGTADSSNTGANMGGTMGSSIMKKGGGVEDISKSLYVEKFYDRDGNIIGYTIKDKLNVSGNYTLSSKKERAEENRQYLIDNPSRLAYYRKNEYKTGGKLIGKQKNLDLNKNGKLDSEDFKMIRGNKKANGGGLSDLPENPNNDAISYKTGGKIESGMIVIGKKGTKNEGKEFSVAYTHPPYPNKITLFSMKDKSMKHFDAEKKDYISKYANGGGLANTPESFPSNDAVSYGEGGGTKGYKLTLKNWDADVYEDDYNEGEGKQVNSFSEKVNKSFATGEELLKYISNNVLYHDVKKEYYSIMDDDGRIVTSILVDEYNSAASENEIEEWKNGNKKLYSANYNFYITLTQEKTPSADELSKLLGISVYKKGGRLSKYANGGSTKGFEYTIGGL